MRSVLTILSVVAMITANTFADDEGFRPLFNGDDLTGWTRTNTAESTWTVKDDMLICSGKPIGELRTTRMYQNFILEVEWRHMVPKGNAGIFIWSDDITARGVPFHRGVEVQVLENDYGNTRGHTTHGDIFPIHGAKMTPINGRGGSRAFPTENRSKPSPEWNHYRIECNAGQIALAVNGEVVTRGIGCSPSKGYICIESEGGIVHYRNMRIKELPDSPVDAADVAIADRGYRCIYNGIDLTGWDTAADNDGHWQSRDWVLAYDGKSDADDASIQTTESFGDFGFLVDVRLKADPSSVNIELGDQKLITISSGSKRGVSAKPGAWSRIEVEVNDGRLMLHVNGEEIGFDSSGERISKAPLRLVPRGAIDIANPYVRDLPKK